MNKRREGFVNPIIMLFKVNEVSNPRIVNLLPYAIYG